MLSTSYAVTLVIPGLVPHILLTCKAIYAEAAAVLEKLNRHSTARVIFDFGNTLALGGIHARCDFIDSVAHVLSEAYLGASARKKLESIVFHWFGVWNIGEEKEGMLRAFFREAWYGPRANSGAHLDIALRGTALTDTVVRQFVADLANNWHLYGVAVTVYEAPSTRAGRTLDSTTLGTLYGGVINERTWRGVWMRKQGYKQDDIWKRYERVLRFRDHSVDYSQSKPWKLSIDTADLNPKYQVCRCDSRSNAKGIYR